MRKELQFIKETIELDQQGIKNSIEVADELVTADLLLALGYDRRRNKDIRRIRKPGSSNPEYIWKMFIDSDRTKVVIIKTVPYGAKLTNYISPDLINNSECLVLTNCVQLGIFSKDGMYEPLAIVDIFSDSDKTEEILKVLEKDGNIKGFLDERNKDLIRQNAKNLITRYDLSMISSDFCRKTKLTPEEIVDILKKQATKQLDNSESKDAKGTEGTEDLDNTANTNNTELNDEVLRLTTENNELKAKNTELEQTIKSLEDAADEAAEKLENSDIEKENLQKDLDTLRDEAEDLRAQLSVIQSREEDNNPDSTEESENSDTDKPNGTENVSGVINAYIIQIQNLCKQLSDKDDELKDKERQLESLTQQLETKVDPKIEEAKNLLDTIEDNPNLPKSYVGVVDGNLFQAPNLEKFVGSSLQELYSKVTFELMPYIFDGDIFNISDKPVRSDLLIANKMYDIDLSNMSEEESLQRLQTLFNKFPSVVFFFKTIGVDAEPNNISDEAIDFGEIDNINFGEGFSDYENTVENSELISEKNLGIQSENFDDTSKVEFGEKFNVEEGTDVFKGPEENADNQLSVIPLSGFSKFLWDESISFSGIEYIDYVKRSYSPDESQPYASMIFKIDNETLRSQVESLICSVINFSDSKDKPKVINQINFSDASNFVSIPATPDESEGIPIVYSKYQINSSILAQTIPIITKICDEISVDTNFVNLYVKANIPEDNAFYGSLVSKDSISLNDEVTKYVEGENKDAEVHCIVSGTIDELVNSNENVLKAESHIVKNCIAVKTDYLTYPLRTSDDASHIFTEMLAMSEIPIEEAIDKLGFILGTELRVISRNAEEVATENYSTTLNGDTYYISDMEPWQLMNVLIKLHMICTGNKNIGIRAILNKEALDFYSNWFFTHDPTLAESIKSLAVYLNNRLK